MFDSSQLLVDPRTASAWRELDRETKQWIASTKGLSNQLVGAYEHLKQVSHDFNWLLLSIANADGAESTDSLVRVWCVYLQHVQDVASKKLAVAEAARAEVESAQAEEAT